MDAHHAAKSPAACVEHGTWTPIPGAVPALGNALKLRLADIDLRQHERVVKRQRMTFHAVGCTGAFEDHRPQFAVADAMAAQVEDPGSVGHARRPATSASFLYHLGDITYKPGATSDVSNGEGTDVGGSGPDIAGAGADVAAMYNDQFYAPYTRYHRSIFAIAGNHDGKYNPQRKQSPIDHFVANFCAAKRSISRDNATDARPTMPQPYVYWRLSTPLAVILGLYANIANGGILDDPARPGETPQFDWLVAQLRAIAQRNARRYARRKRRKAVILAVHYPPYSGASDFALRGDPTLGPTNAHAARPLAAWLQEAFARSGQRPDLILSAHAHLYQRLTYRYADGHEVPYLVAGSGGHGPVESLWRTCDHSVFAPQRTPPFDAVLPQGLALPQGDRVQVVAYNDQEFGFLRLTVTPETLFGEFFAVAAGTIRLDDSFSLNLDAHHVA